MNFEKKNFLKKLSNRCPDAGYKKKLGVFSCPGSQPSEKPFLKIFHI